MTYSEAKYEVKRLRAIPWREKTKEEWNQLSEAYEAYGIERNVIWCSQCKHQEPCPMHSFQPMTNCNFYTEEEEDEED